MQWTNQFNVTDPDSSGIHSFRLGTARSSKTAFHVMKDKNISDVYFFSAPWIIWWKKRELTCLNNNSLRRPYLYKKKDSRAARKWWEQKLFISSEYSFLLISVSICNRVIIFQDIRNFFSKKVVSKSSSTSSSTSSPVVAKKTRAKAIQDEDDSGKKTLAWYVCTCVTCLDICRWNLGFQQIQIVII